MRLDRLILRFGVCMAAAILAVAGGRAAVAAQNHHRGIQGRPAPELAVDYWIGTDGKQTDPVRIKDYRGKMIYLYCFQAWCPGCHSRGFPTLVKISRSFEKDDRIVFLAVQTVFEGHATNTKGKLATIQERYGLKLPFGHDAGSKTSHGVPTTMANYRTGGTPWVILIDQDGKVIYNDFHIDVDKAPSVIRELLAKER